MGAPPAAVGNDCGSFAGFAAGDSFDAFRKFSREVLPLPVPDNVTVPRWRGLPLSRGVVRRVQAKHHQESWLRDGVLALNRLFVDQDVESPGCTSASVAQLECLSRLRSLYKSVGAPEVEQSAREAWTELQGSLPGYSSSEIGAMAEFREGRVALPPVGSRPVELVDELGREDRLFLEHQSRVLLDERGAREKLSLSGLKEPYMDPVLRHSRRTYGRFVSDLYRRGVVKFGATCRGRVVAFFRA